MSARFKRQVRLEMQWGGQWIPDGNWTKEWELVVREFKSSYAPCRIVMRGGIVIAEKEGIDEGKN